MFDQFLLIGHVCNSECVTSDIAIGIGHQRLVVEFRVISNQYETSVNIQVDAYMFARLKSGAFPDR